VLPVTATLGLARPDDALPIAEMSRDTIECGLGWSWTPQRVLRFIGDRDSTVIVARRHARLAAFAIMAVGDRSAHLNLFAVAPPDRRKGLGSRLIDWLVATATEAAVLRIDLELRASNLEARAFYSRSGFAQTGSAPGYYRGREAAVNMSRDLALRS